MTYEQLFKNNSRPVGVLFKSSMYMEDYSGITPAMANHEYVPIDSDIRYAEDKVMLSDDGDNYRLLNDIIPVYAQMTNTLEFLKANGYDIQDEELKIKEVLYTDSPLSFTGAKLQFVEANQKSYHGPGSYENLLYSSYYHDLMFNHTWVHFYGNDMMEYIITEPITEYDLLKKMYKEVGHPLISVTDTEKTREIVDFTVSQFFTLGDEGRYVYVIYEDGVMVCYYLPEANISVLK